MLFRVWQARQDLHTNTHNAGNPGCLPVCSDLRSSLVLFSVLLEGTLEFILSTAQLRIESTENCLGQHRWLVVEAKPQIQ